MSIKNIKTTIATLSHMVTKGEKHTQETISMMVDSFADLVLLDLELSKYRQAMEDLIPIMDKEKYARVYELLGELNG